MAVRRALGGGGMLASSLSNPEDPFGTGPTPGNLSWSIVPPSYGGVNAPLPPNPVVPEPTGAPPGGGQPPGYPVPVQPIGPSAPGSSSGGANMFSSAQPAGNQFSLPSAVPPTSIATQANDLVQAPQSPTRVALEAFSPFVQAVANQVPPPALVPADSPVAPLQPTPASPQGQGNSSLDLASIGNLLPGGIGTDVNTPALSPAGDSTTLINGNTSTGQERRDAIAASYQRWLGHPPRDESDYAAWWGNDNFDAEIAASPEAQAYANRGNNTGGNTTTTPPPPGVNFTPYGHATLPPAPGGYPEGDLTAQLIQVQQWVQSVWSHYGLQGDPDTLNNAILSELQNGTPAQTIADQYFTEWEHHLRGGPWPPGSTTGGNGNPTPPPGGNNNPGPPPPPPPGGGGPTGIPDWLQKLLGPDFAGPSLPNGFAPAGTGGVFGNELLQQMGEDPLSQIIAAAIAGELQTGGTPYGANIAGTLQQLISNGGQSQSSVDLRKKLTDFADKGGGFNTDAFNTRFLNLRDAEARAEMGLNASARASLADRGLLGESGAAQGPEASAIERIQQGLAPDFAKGVSDAYTAEADAANARIIPAYGLAADLSKTGDQNVLSALSMATGLAEDQAHNVLSAIGAGTQRQQALANIALSVLDENRQWNEFLANYGLQKDQVAAQIKDGRLAAILPILQLFLQSVGTASGGFI